MSNPWGRGFDSEEETQIAAQKAAKRSGRKEAETRERRQQILDYYSRGKRRRTV